MKGKYRGKIDCTEKELQDILSQYKGSKLPCPIDEKGWIYGNFKGWIHGNFVNGKTPYIIGEIRESTPHGETVFDYWYPVKKDTVGQYIGRKDKNDTEIYEGDIICISYKDKKDSVTGIIVYDIFKSKFDLIYYSDFDDNYECHIVKECSAYFNNSNIDNFEVIGNIHDNPELSEVRK